MVRGVMEMSLTLPFELGGTAEADEARVHRHVELCSPAFAGTGFDGPRAPRVADAAHLQRDGFIRPRSTPLDLDSVASRRHRKTPIVQDANGLRVASPAWFHLQTRVRRYLAGRHDPKRRILDAHWAHDAVECVQHGEARPCANVDVRPWR